MHYQRRLLNLLSSVDIPLDAIRCTDFLCTDHQTVISQYCSDIASCLEDAGKTTIPKCKPSGKRIAGWNDEVRPSRDESIFWHRLWKDCGSPTSGWVAQIRRKTRAEYHRAVRSVKSRRQSLIAGKMARR